MRIPRFRLRTSIYVLGFISIVSSLNLLPVKADDSLSNTQSPIINCNKDFAGNCGNAVVKQHKADQFQKKPDSNGSEHLGDANGQPPGHAGGNNSGNVASGGPDPIAEKNTQPVNAAPVAGEIAGGVTKCAITSAFGSMVDYQPYTRKDMSVMDLKSTEHNKGAVGNAMVQSGQNLGAAGQSDQGANLINSQMEGNAAQISAIAANNADQFAQKVPDPRGWAHVAKGVQEAQNAQNSDNQGNCCKQNCQNSFESMKLPLINVANEEAASQCSSDQAFKDESNVIWMVQQMYKKCYVPMAVLFLLPGAVLTQTKSLVSFSMLGVQDEDTQSPFIGIFRSMMAIFLIPATQLTVSYCIDIGNAMTDPVAKRVQVETLMNWVNQQAYSSDPKNNDNTIKKTASNMGKLAGTPAESVVQERQNDLTVTVQNMFNTINNMLSQGLNVLNGFQIVMMCYLFLLGPIAAALYAWPAGIGQNLFKKAFSSWLDGVIVLSLWKFWWCVILLCMVVRLQSGSVDPNSHYEMYYFSAFMGILVMAPFQPFEFHPGDIVSHVLEKAQQGGGAGGSGGASGSGGTPQKNGNTGGANSGVAQTKTAGSGNISQSGDIGAGSKPDG